jgi:hypothetical protein
MAVRKRGSVWWYDFMIRGVRYRDRVPEATTKKLALDAEATARREVFEGRYGKPVGDKSFSEYLDEVVFKWSKENKRTWRDDVECTPGLRH